MRLAGRAESLNDSCFCVTADRRGLDAALGSGGESLFADVPFFVSETALSRMLAVLDAVTALSATKAYRSRALDHAETIAQADPGPRGAFMGYDFHIENDVPHLIEINTNAGGAALNDLLLNNQKACCAEVKRSLSPPEGESFATRIVRMFEAEWQSQFGSRPLRRIAIVDDEPHGQFLYPEFVLFERLLASAGYDVVIADAASLSFEGGVLTAEGKPIDLVYNRLVDFMLAEPRHAALREAYLAHAAVVTPNPHVHALLANKRNLALLANRDFLAASGLSADHVAALSSSLPTIEVSRERAGELWRDRRDWFFKPADGYGSKAVYRGDKVTRGAFAQLLEGGYVAQRFAPPGRRTIRRDEGEAICKADVRLYAYGGEPLLLAARLYQGQATNFRTPGGGFAPVYVV